MITEHRFLHENTPQSRMMTINACIRGGQNMPSLHGALFAQLSTQTRVAECSQSSGCCGGSIELSEVRSQGGLSEILKCDR